MKRPGFLKDVFQTYPNAGGGQRGTTGGNPKPKPAKIDNTLKPKGKLTNEMSLLEATEWIKEYRTFMAHNATNLEHQEAKVPRELLEVNIDPTMKLKLRSKAKPDTSVNDCLNILEKVYLLVSCVVSTLRVLSIRSS